MKKRKNPPTFKRQKINLQNLRKILKRMKGKRSQGMDNIDSYSLKLAGSLIEDSLLHLINLSITNQTFSAQWKPQLIFPLHKKDKKTDVKKLPASLSSGGSWKAGRVCCV